MHEGRPRRDALSRNRVWRGLRRGPRGRRRRRGRGGGVVELLLGAEQRVQDLGAQVRAERERQAGADAQEQQLAAEAALALLGLLRALAQRRAGVLQSLCGSLEVLVELLVVGQ